MEKVDGVDKICLNEKAREYFLTGNDKPMNKAIKASVEEILSSKRIYVVPMSFSNGTGLENCKLFEKKLC